MRATFATRRAIRQTTSTGDERPVIVEAGPRSELTTVYRARVFQSDERLKAALEAPDLEVGPPPTRAATAGRMNALGISVFYGALDELTAIAEVRPPVASRVLLGRFDIVRPLKLLDLEALRTLYVAGSVFDPDYRPRVEQAVFLERLSRRIARPVMPDDEPFDYLPSQVVADYLAAEADPPLDGMIFPSVQGRGRNVVLFHKSSRVAAIELPPDTRVSAEIRENEKDLEFRYSVLVEVPPEAPKHDQAPPTAKFPARPLEDDRGPLYDWREPTLRLDASSLKVCRIKSVLVNTDDSNVQRRHLTGGGLPF